MFSPDDHLIIAHLFPRLLGIIYFFALAPFLFQIQGLIGSQGILPVELYLNHFRHKLGKRRFYWLPTLFWVNCSDRALMALPAAGTLLSVLLICGVYPSLLLPLLFLIHLSIVTVGQDFLSFGWEMYFLEISCNAFFMSLTPTPNLAIWISFYLLIFRFHLQAGTSKLISKEKVWRDLTALSYHYESQPLPNTIAWFFHKLPLWFHKFSTVFALAIEIVLPFALFGPKEMQLAAFCGFFLLQFFIWVSGNYSYLNHMTVVLISLLISDAYLSHFLTIPKVDPNPLYLDVFLYLVGAALIILQLLRLWIHFFPNRKMARVFLYVEPFHIANRYGIFAIMTRTRYEIVIKGSADGRNWKEYLFWYKPSELTRRPRRISPYQPRIDWQAWFLPFQDFNSCVWFQNFLFRLLQGSKPVLALLRFNPFPDNPPKYLRAIVYVYEFSSTSTKKARGEWWNRIYVKDTHPPYPLSRGKALRDNLRKNAEIDSLILHMVAKGVACAASSLWIFDEDIKVDKF